MTSSFCNLRRSSGFSPFPTSALYQGRYRVGISGAREGLPTTFTGTRDYDVSPRPFIQVPLYGAGR